MEAVNYQAKKIENYLGKVELMNIKNQTEEVGLFRDKVVEKKFGKMKDAVNIKKSRVDNVMSLNPVDKRKKIQKEAANIKKITSKKLHPLQKRKQQEGWRKDIKIHKKVVNTKKNHAEKAAPFTDNKAAKNKGNYLGTYVRALISKFLPEIKNKNETEGKDFGKMYPVQHKPYGWVLATVRY